MKMKTFKKLPIYFVGMLIIASFGFNTYAQINDGDEDGCDRRLVVTVLNPEEVDPFCDVEVRLVFSDGTVYSTPFIQGQAVYEFYRTSSFTGHITAKLVPLNCEDCNLISRSRYFPSLPCNSYFFNTGWASCD